MYKVTSIEFRLEDARFIIKAKDCTGNRDTDIVFYQVLAYHFIEVGRENIIDEIADGTMLGFWGWYYSVRTPQEKPAMTYGLPLAFADKASALKALEKKYTYFEINACIGMDGFIVAKAMKVTKS